MRPRVQPRPRDLPRRKHYCAAHFFSKRAARKFLAFDLRHRLKCAVPDVGSSLWTPSKVGSSLRPLASRRCPMTRYFISYSPTTSLDFALKLCDDLVAEAPSFDTWMDKRDLKPGVDWDKQVPEAISACDGL